MSLVDLLGQTLSKRIHLQQNTPLIVGVSGGADSLALLHGLVALQGRFGYALHVATLDHGLRGAASTADAAFVAATAQAWGLPVTTERVQIAATIGVEAAARTARYDFLARVAQVHNATHIAAGHHAGDQAETVLLHLLRGAGPDGLSGMDYTAPVPGHPHLTLIRPLLDVTRDQIEAYCREHDLEPRQDTTNRDTTYLRNRLRHEILPLLMTVNPQVERSLNRLASAARHDRDYFAGQIATFAANHVTITPQHISIDRQAFRALHPALAARCIAAWAAQLGSESGHEHITTAVEIGQHGSTGAMAVLPGGLRLRVDYARLELERSDRDDLPALNGPLLQPGTQISVPAPGSTSLPGWTLHVTETPLADGVALAIPAPGNLTLRTRQPGDRFAPPGLEGHTQKLKQWLSDHKIPRNVRDHLPVLLVNQHIAAVIIGAHWVVSANFAASQANARILYFTFVKENGE